MTAVARTHVGGRLLDLHWRTRSVAALILGLATIGIWWPVFGGAALWSVPVLVWAGLIATRVVAPKSRWGPLWIALSWVVWVPLSGLLIGLPASILDPTAARDNTHELILGLRSAMEGTPGPWSLAGWLAFVGLCWIRGAANATRRGNASAAWAFIYFAAPFVLAMVLGRSDDAGWHGAILLGAAVLWATAGGLRSALPAVALVALLATVASAFGPTERQVRAGGSAGEQKANGEVDWSMGLGQDHSAHTGATYFDIQSDTPALWRAQVLDHFNGATWTASVRDPSTDLPQPGAVPSTATVTIRRFHDVRAIGAGRITSVTGGPPSARSSLGESTQFTTQPSSGTSYTVTSQVVRSSAQELASVPIPSTADYLDELTLWDPVGGARTPMGRYADRLPPDLKATPWGQVVTLAHDLSQGTSSELEVVRRVQDYLLDPNRFRYSRTDVSDDTQQPLITFLTQTHSGYCQHFAGAAALLLRLAGVPTRVAVGFATGKDLGGGHYRVADADAHAWIEVYFEGYGWVPFNPTPSSADADVASSIDPIQPQHRSTGSAGSSRTIGLVVLGGFAVVGLGLLVRWWRRRDGEHEALAERLVRLAPGSARPSTTVASVMPDLARLGPSVAALGELAERERFDPTAEPLERPRTLVWRALVADLGRWRALRVMLLGAPQPPGAGGAVETVHGAQHLPAAAGTLGDSASVAPPGGRA